MSFSEEEDLHWMQKALKEAEKAYEEGEVPVGAVLVYQNKVIAKSYNQVEKLQDPTAHAEMLCLTSGSSYFNNWRLQECTLYCTLEPCCMCAGALFAARIRRHVWAASEPRLGAGGSWVDLFSLSHPFHKIEIRQGVLQEVSSSLLKKFFQNRRKTSLER